MVHTSPIILVCYRERDRWFQVLEVVCIYIYDCGAAVASRLEAEAIQRTPSMATMRWLTAKRID